MLIALVALAGCDQRPATVAVSGKVLIDGQPLKYGAVVFVPEGGRSSFGTLDSEGHFALTCFTPNDGALPGKHRIQVVARETINNTTARIHAPLKYGELQTSGLSEEIKSSTDALVIQLTWKGSAPGKPYTEKSGAAEDEGQLSKRFRRKG